MKLEHTTDADLLFAQLQANNTLETIKELTINSAIPVHKDVTIQDLEAFMPWRRRYRGTMTTTQIDQFAEYTNRTAGEVQANGEEPGVTVPCFVDPENMTAKVFFDLGTVEQPGHADHEEFVQVGPGDGEETKALEDRVPLVHRLFEHVGRVEADDAAAAGRRNVLCVQLGGESVGGSELWSEPWRGQWRGSGGRCWSRVKSRRLSGERPRCRNSRSRTSRRNRRGGGIAPCCARRRLDCRCGRLPVFSGLDAA